MPLRDDLLTPIPGDNPSGLDLRYDPVYDKLKEARREDDGLPQGDWQTERKTADYALVVKLAGELLATKTKDLQVAAWLTEAMLKREGYAGLGASLGLLHALLDRFWDTLYPEIEDGDLELRAGPLEWVGAKLDVAVKQVPLTRGGYSYLQYQESRAVPTEAAVEGDRDKRAMREELLADGKLAPEEFDKSVGETPKAFYKQVVAELDACLAALEQLAALTDERFGGDAPSYGRLRGALEEVQRAARFLLQQKLQTDPDPIEELPAEAAEGAGDGAAATAGGEATGGVLAAEPVSGEDAAGRVVAAARFLRRSAPTNPAPYLMLRGLRWGELRARNGHAYPDPRLLVAPPTAVRSQLKGMLLDGKWRELLEAAEGVMGTAAGRGWLDLQRYVLTACEAMGGEYAPVADAVRTALVALLRDIPELAEMTLMDDTPTANPETQQWLRESVLAADGDGAGPEANGAEPEAEPEPLAVAAEEAEAEAAAAEGTVMAAPTGTRRRVAAAWTPYDRAMAEVRAGRPQRGIELLMREVARERSKRGRFIRRTQVAKIMVDAGLTAVAEPILEELLAQIEEYKLEEWEAGDLVAQPMALLWRCMHALDRDEEAKQALYLRLCRLDPVQALGVQAQ